MAKSKKKIKMIAAKDIPFCECTECLPSLGGCGGRGPAVYSVVRKKKRMKVCSRCDTREDQKSRKLLPNVRRYPPLVLINFDPLGTLCIALDQVDK